ncbi:hypothetical protein BTO20_28965 [Mycobacterium dioxanotrophicus]|uniref:Uncharacterized protein n=1 Tax=Mycobacterium dioxanotrophicus TaxID=482462 RepID=A0A1Y0CAI3_9MYCO|nr:hypothetical protein [Mycobacterium dioxanotrophicus]ART72044.1 hypothetical protein BTO20_28965 [Mycobacterium dioxanotrophicus]
MNPLTYQPVSTPRGKGIAITTTVLAVLCAGINVLAAASVVLMHLFLELLDAVQNWDSLKPDAEQQHSTSAWFVAAAAVLIVAAVALIVGAVQLMLCKTSGQVIVVVSAVISAVALIATPLAWATAMTLSIAPLIVAGFALLPGIRRWCRGTG